MATSRSNALQLFVYMSRTNARGTSAFLNTINLNPRFDDREHSPARQHRHVPPFFTSILCRMRIDIV